MELTINNTTLVVGPDKEGMTLLSFLREELSLPGTKKGCGIGSCGICTVLVDMKPMRSCVLPLRKVAGRRILTIEGLAGADGSLHPVQQAFLDAGAIQCGYCTPGMVMTARALLAENPSPGREEIRRAFRNVLCRCTGYQQIIDAVELASQRLGRGPA